MPPPGGGGGGGAVFETSTVMVVAVLTLPAASRATAVRVWAPSATAVVFHDVEYGAVVSSAPRLTPSRLNWTPTTPTLSLALAVTEIVPNTAAPAAGAVTDTDGAVPSGVVKVRSVEIARLPAWSRDRTR